MQHETFPNFFCKGWKRHGSYCYITGTETKTFDEAKDLCKTLGSYLADVSSRYEQQLINKFVGFKQNCIIFPEKKQTTKGMHIVAPNNFTEYLETINDLVSYLHLWDLDPLHSLSQIYFEFQNI